jgi:hypothetical protein
MIVPPSGQDQAPGRSLLEVGVLIFIYGNYESTVDIYAER